MPIAIHWAGGSPSATSSATSPATSASTARLRASARDPSRAAPISVKGGTIVTSSSKNARKGAGWAGVEMPSDRPRGGSRRVKVQAATSSPGKPTARNAACHPTSPSGPPPG
jgi:hypothetical protein